MFTVRSLRPSSSVTTGRRVESADVVREREDCGDAHKEGQTFQEFLEGQQEGLRVGVRNLGGTEGIKHRLMYVSHIEFGRVGYYNLERGERKQFRLQNTA